MPYIFTLDQLPVGYSLSTGKGGGSIKVTYNEFISSEDGDLFISRLEGWPNLLLEQASVAIRPSHVDHMLAIISKDKHVTVYINELPIVMQIVAKGTLKAGQGVTANHIADIKSVEFNGVKIPNDCGILFLFSQGWRKGLFYDFGPLQHEPTNIDYDVNKVFGQLFSYLLFQDVFKISELEWERMVNQQWFPFITLRREVVTEVINYARNEWNIDELLPKIKGPVTFPVGSGLFP